MSDAVIVYFHMPAPASKKHPSVPELQLLISEEIYDPLLSTHKSQIWSSANVL